MRKAFSEVSERAEDDQVSLRTAAYELGIERVGKRLARAGTSAERAGA